MGLTKQDEYLSELQEKGLLGLSLDGPPRRRNWCLLFFGLVCMSIVIFLGFLLTIVFSPLILLFMFWRWWKFGNPKWRKEPSDQRIAIIGLGWSGVQATARLQEMGVRTIDCFEMLNDVGGATWQKPYANLKCHSSWEFLTFKNFLLKDPTIRYIRPRAQEMQAYIARFAKVFGLDQYFQFRKMVTNVNYDSESKEATVVVKNLDTGELETHGPYDFVIYASLATQKRIPDLKEKEIFKGEIYHSSDVNTKVYEKLVESGKKILIVGGSKSALDMTLSFENRIQHDRLTLLFRKPYVFQTSEDFHGTSALDKLIGFYHLMAWSLSAFFPTFGWWLSKNLDHFITFDENSTHADIADWTSFHFGLMDRWQKKVIHSFKNKVRGNPNKYYQDGIILDGGKKIEADIIIFATGYTTGLANIKFEKDNEKHELNTKDPLYYVGIVPTFPCLGLADQMANTIGPKGGIPIADLVLYYLCVLKTRPTEKQMKKVAKWNLFRNDATVSILFQRGFWKTFPLTLINQLWIGLVPIVPFLVYNIKFLAFKRVNGHLETGLIPNPKPQGRYDQSKTKPLNPHV